MADGSPESRAAAVVAAQGQASAAEHRREYATAIALYNKSLALAATLYAPDSLVLACSHLVLVPQRWNLAQLPGCGPLERAKQLRACMANLAAGHDVLDARRAAGTLSAPREDEAVFEAARREGLRGIQGPGAPPPQMYAVFSSFWVPHFGFLCALWGAIGCVAALFGGEVGLCGPAETARYQKALLHALDMVATVRGGPDPPPGLSNQEISLAGQVQDVLSQPGVRSTPYGMQLAASWERPTVRGRLLAQGLPQMAAQMAARYSAEARAAAARVAARGGLRACGLDSCGAREAHAAHFQVCSRCRVVAYCSVEHGAEHWRASHKRECKALAEAAAAAAAAPKT